MTSAAVIATVLGYIAVLFAVAWVSGRRADNAGFFSGNRRTPWYMAAFAMIGAAMSGVTFISVPGSVAVDGFSYMQMVAGFTVGQLIVAFVLIPTFYRLKVVSLYEYLDDRFGVRSHRTGAWFFFVSKMLGAALRIYVVCAVMQLLVFSHYGLPFWLNAAVTMLFVWLYTQQGGVKSLIWTDTLKTVCLVGSLVLSIVFIMQALGMSLPEMTREVAASPYSKMFFFDDPSSDRYFWKMFAAGIAAQTFCLAAWERGDGTVITGNFDEEKITRLLNLPENQKVGCVIGLGYPDEEPATPKRKSVEDLLTYK